MNYIFAFIGEFGYELFNWQGVVRKWANNYKKDNDKIIICSRKGLDILYEFCDFYIDISEVESLKSSVADCYTSYVFLNGTGPHLPRSEWQAARAGEHITNIKNDIMALVNEQISTYSLETKWVWSCDYEIIEGLHFGLERPGGIGGIYNVGHNQLKVNNNEYVKLEYNEMQRSPVEEKLEFSLNEDYILCQTGFRIGYSLSDLKPDYSKILQQPRDIKVVLMDFKTNRLNDSLSAFNVKGDRFYNIQVSSLAEQGVLINYATRCTFFTEGHLRSHTYLPPMFGKDVDVIADEKIFSLHEAPLSFWNKNVFKFGGQMFAIPIRESIDNND